MIDPSEARQVIAWIAALLAVLWIALEVLSFLSHRRRP